MGIRATMNTAKVLQLLLVLLSFIITPFSIAEDAVDITFVISKFVVEGDNPLGDDALDLLTPTLVSISVLTVCPLQAKN